MEIHMHIWQWLYARAPCVRASVRGWLQVLPAADGVDVVDVQELECGVRVVARVLEPLARRLVRLHASALRVVCPPSARTRTLNARASVLAAANPIHGRYNRNACRGRW